MGRTVPGKCGNNQFQVLVSDILLYYRYTYHNYVDYMNTRNPYSITAKSQLCTRLITILHYHIRWGI